MARGRLVNGSPMPMAGNNLSGFMSKEDKAKLNNLTNYVHPDDGGTGGTIGPTGTQTPDFGQPINIGETVYNEKGHVLRGINRQAVLPENPVIISTTQPTARENAVWINPTGKGYVWKNDLGFYTDSLTSTIIGSYHFTNIGWAIVNHQTGMCQLSLSVTLDMGTYFLPDTATPIGALVPDIAPFMQGTDQNLPTILQAVNLSTNTPFIIDAWVANDSSSMIYVRTNAPNLAQVSLFGTYFVKPE